MTSMLVPVMLVTDFNGKINDDGLDRLETCRAMMVMPQCIFNFDDKEIEVWDNPSNIWPEEYIIENALLFVEEHGGWAAFCREAVDEGWTD